MKLSDSFRPSRHACPRCKNPLMLREHWIESRRVQIWCPHPCPSVTANAGAWGRSEDDAFRKLTGELGKDQFP